MTLPPIRAICRSHSLSWRVQETELRSGGFTLYTYAAMQVFADAGNTAKSVKLDRSRRRCMPINRYRDRQYRLRRQGDVVGPDYVVFEWNDGKYAELKNP